jgi:thioredoxin reductase
LSHGFFGQDGKPPSAILATARAQLLSYPTVRFAEALARHAGRTDRQFTVELSGGEIHTASRLILATGITDDLSALPGLHERWGTSVLHCFYCHGYEVAGRRLGVIATSERSLQTAMLLPDWSEHVTLFTNGAIQLGCQFDDGPSGPFVRTESDKQTSVHGVYAAGDAARSGHNASWAAADGVTAGISAHQSLSLAQSTCR